MKDLTLYTVDSQLEELIEYRQSRVDDPDAPAAEDELAEVDVEIERYMGGAGPEGGRSGGLASRL